MLNPGLTRGESRAYIQGYCGDQLEIYGTWISVAAYEEMIYTKVVLVCHSSQKRQFKVEDGEDEGADDVDDGGDDQKARRKTNARGSRLE